MARINIYDFVKSISKESISHPDVAAVNVNGKDDLPKNVQEDTRQENPTDDVDAVVKDTKTTEPGPANGGGDGTAEFNSAEKAKTHVNVKDLHFDGDQNGGRERDQAPNKVKAKDGLSASDVRTSVEEHTQSSEVADIKTIETGGAEVVEEADCLVMDIDNETEESAVSGILSQTEIDAEVMGKILKDVGELEKAKASVEGYLYILNKMEKRGIEMSNELRRSISIGLESISEELFKSEIITLEGFRVSNEANGVALRGGQGSIDDDTEYDGARDKTSKGLSGKLKQIYEAIKKALHRAISAGIDMWNSFVTDTTKLSEHLKGLRKRVSTLEGGKKISLNNATRLMHGGEFAGGSSEAVKRLNGVSKTFLMDWPNKLGTLTQEIRKTATGQTSNVSEEQLKDKFFNVVTNAFTPFKELSPNDRSKAPSGFLDAYKLRWSGPLLGNRAVYVGLMDSDDATNVSNLVKLAFSAVPELETNSGSVEIETPDAGEAIAVIRELETLLNNVKSYREGMVELKKYAAQIEADSSGHAGRAFIDRDEPRFQAVIFSLALIRGTAESQHHYVGYLISTVKAYIGFLEGAIKNESGSDKGTTVDA